jgi:hypothetical protein
MGDDPMTDKYATRAMVSLYNELSVSHEKEEFLLTELNDMKRRAGQ